MGKKSKTVEAEEPTKDKAEVEAKGSAPTAPLDILILAGQSNIAGRGKLSEDDPSPPRDVARFSAAGLWEPAMAAFI